MRPEHPEPRRHDLAQVSPAARGPEAGTPTTCGSGRGARTGGAGEMLPGTSPAPDRWRSSLTF